MVVNKSRNKATTALLTCVQHQLLPLLLWISLLPSSGPPARPAHTASSPVTQDNTGDKPHLNSAHFVTPQFFLPDAILVDTVRATVQDADARATLLGGLMIAPMSASEGGIHCAFRPGAEDANALQILHELEQLLLVFHVVNGVKTANSTRLS
jgi:hypothetical protein